MANITVYRDPAGIKPPQVELISGEVNLAEWMLANVVEGSQNLHCQILLNGREIVNTEAMSVEQCCKNTAIVVGIFDNVTIKFRPQGIELSAWAIAAIAIGAAALTIALAPKPRIPGQVDTGGDKRSSNNQLNSSSNSFRPRQAIPNIAGQVISYPDFAQRSYYYYDAAGRRVFEEWFIFGVGQYTVEDIKEGETPILTIPGYDCATTDESNHPARLLNVSRAISSTDIDILSLEQQTKSIYPDSGIVNATLGRITLTSTLINDLGITVGTIVYMSLTVLAEMEPGVDEFFVNGSYEVYTVGPDWFEVLLNDFVYSGEIQSGIISNEEFEPQDIWYVLDGSLTSEVWFHLKMPTGIRKGDGTDATVSATLTIELLDSNGDPTGTTFSRGASFFGNTQNQQAATFKITENDGITVGKYRAKVNRITALLGDNSLDLLVLDGIDAVSYYEPAWGNVQALYLKRVSGQRINQGSSAKINAKVTRKLRIYDNGTGVYGTEYVATRRFCDYAFYLLHEIARVPISRINTDELFGIQENLSDQQLGYFDYTFDDGNVGLKEALGTCCNAARVRYWNEGLLWSFVREEAKPVKSLMFNRRNLTPNSSRYVQKFRRPSDYDSVTIIYVDPVKNAEKRVSRKIDGSGSIIAGAGIRPLDIPLSGCRNDFQALNRCELEVRRLIYQAIKVNDTALTDGQLARLGMRIDWVDQYDLDVFDGELLSVSTNQYKTSERFEPESGVEYWVYVTDESGQPSNSVRAYARADGNIFGFQADGLTGAFIADGVIQSGSRYFICSDDDSAASTFTVIGRGRPNEAGECDIELAEYNELMFSED